jgi:hypothetical protein
MGKRSADEITQLLEQYFDFRHFWIKLLSCESGLAANFDERMGDSSSAYPFHPLSRIRCQLPQKIYC